MASGVFNMEAIAEIIGKGLLVCPFPIAVRQSSDYHDPLTIQSVPRYIPCRDRPYDGPMDWWVLRGGIWYAGPYPSRERAQEAVDSQIINEALNHRLRVEGVDG